jgi:hypothetical protein
MIYLQNYDRWLRAQMAKLQIGHDEWVTTLSSMATFDAQDARLKRATLLQETIHLEKRLNWFQSQIKSIATTKNDRRLHIYYDTPSHAELSSVSKAICEFYSRALCALVPTTPPPPFVVNLEIFEEMLGLTEATPPANLLFCIHGNLLTHRDNQWSHDPVARDLWESEFACLCRETKTHWVRIIVI